MFLKADGMPFSTDYMEWGLRRSERDCEGPLFSETEKRDDRERERQAEGRSRHRDEQPDQDPGHRRPLLGHGEADIWLVRGGRWALPLGVDSSPITPRLDVQALLRSKSAPGEKRIKTTRPKSRRREQGTEVKLCPLCLNTTEGAHKKEARFNSTANGDGRSILQEARARSRKAAQGRRASERSRTAPKSRATRRQVRRRGGLLREGGARHVNAEPSL